ncbi:MAG: CFI-box-CTERM domain-containing protein [Planctomycetota bacterium]|nr:CFI-box-CTERM domain-containing protein [Planctomycetota bacterium]
MTDAHDYDAANDDYRLWDIYTPLPAGQAVWIYSFTDNRIGNFGDNYVAPRKADFAPVSAPGMPPAPPSDSDSSAGGAGGGCFIATAAFSSLAADNVRALTDVRDSTLNSASTGTALVDLYYSISPEPAAALKAREAVKAIVRELLD